jgi:uncharacterized repeat protein (TIGR03837 family)
MPIQSWDIFCTVIDNYGDIGVSWRLARQLAQEHGHAVRLWVDDLASFSRIAPGLDPHAQSQRLAGIDIRRWCPRHIDAAEDARRFAGIQPHDAVIEAFACNLPDPFIARMAQREARPVWINLEYLSAEPWVREHHAMSSPHPTLPLTKFFFFPGFEPGTGGLVRESMLGAQRATFKSSPAAHASLWHRLGVIPDPEALRISLFAYPNPALPALLDQWKDGTEPIHCLVPAGLAASQLGKWAGVDASPGTSIRQGNLRADIVPFVRQEHYDELLWACDLNFVRGEDSFVRAQWALQPFVWHIYPQADAAHRIKLDAFLSRYASALESAHRGPAARALTAFWHAWNGDGTAPQWAELRAALAELRAHAPQWERGLVQLGDLAANLVAFCENRVKC